MKLENLPKMPFRITPSVGSAFRWTFFVISLLFFCHILHAWPTERQAEQWLVAGPVSVTPPAFEKNENLSKSLLQFKHIDMNTLWPEEDQKILWDKETELSWTIQVIFIEMEKNPIYDIISH